ncbi:hypothetical protein ACX80U_12080 [Arthrobacter sp. TmT3-37]
MYPHPNGETIIVHPYEGEKEDDHGNESPTFGPDREVEGCGIDPNGATSEPSRQNRSLVIEEYRVFGPHDIELGAQDEVTVRGVRCTVQGDPNAGRSRNVFTGWAPGCEFIVRRVEG